jgi:hypothetical protein
MARQVRNKMGFNEESNKVAGNGAGFFSIIRNLLGINRNVDGSTSALAGRCIESFEANPEFESVKEAETLVTRAKMLQ